MLVDQKQGPYSSNSEAVRLELSQIDASIRSAALFFVISAIAWLMIGTVFALVVAVKAHQPNFAYTFEFSNIWSSSFCAPQCNGAGLGD